MKKLTLRKALEIIGLAKNYAEKIDEIATIAIIDDGGNLIALHRMDGGKIGHIDMAIQKAWTALAFQNNTSYYVEGLKSGKMPFGLYFTNKARPAFIEGGVPIKDGDEIIGGIGVVSSAVVGDEEICRAGLEALR